MIDFDWARRARTRPGYATYRRTPAGDPTSPYRPVRSEDVATIDTRCADPATCTACRSGRGAQAYSPLAVDAVAETRAAGPLPPLPDSANPPDAPKPAAAGPDGLAQDERELVDALVREGQIADPRPWWVRMTRRKP